MPAIGAASVRLPAATVVVAALACSVRLLPGRPGEFDSLIGMPWFVIAGLFAVTQACPVTVRIDGRPRRLSLVAAPVVLGLFLGDPPGLVLGAAVGTGAALLALRRPGLVRVAWEAAAAAATGTTAVAVFARLASDGPGTGRATAAGLAAVAAAVVAVVLSAAVNLVVLGWSGERRSARTDVGAVIVDAATAAPSAVLGAIGVLAFPHAEAALPLAATAVAALLGQRALATLARRQAALERLYRLSDALVDAPALGDVVRSVLVQSLELLDAGYAEVLLDGPGPGPDRVAWTARAGGDVLGPLDGRPLAQGLAFPPTQPCLLPDGSAAERTALRVRSVDGAVLVPLRVGPDLAGHLLVAGRSGEGRGFTAVDVRLLVTVANHAKVALSNVRLIERLQVEARRDELTGLPNRTHFHELLERACDAGPPGPGFAVMLLDFDGFKAVNDTLGHPAGDELLRTLARRLADVAGQDTTVARLGGDEFAVLAPARGDEPSARALAARLLSVFDEPVEVAGTRLRLGESLGIALSPRHATSACDLIRDADVAMYAAKGGAGGSRVFHEDLLEGSALTLSLGSDLRDAVARDEIEVALHPVVVLPSGALHSVEVLARWTHPAHGEVSPEQLFRAAEQAGLTPALSARILDRALGLCRRWLDDGQAVRVAVNIAPRWLADAALPEQVGQALARHGVPADLLCLELTERSVIADPGRATTTLERLRGIGVHLTLDDFGTGYSSLTYLSRLPVDQLKIDEAFVGRVRDSPRDLAIVRSIVDLGHRLGLEVVAEGVTDACVRQALADAGCRLAQGYLFARPFEPELLAGFIADAASRRPSSAVPAARQERVPESAGPRVVRRDRDDRF